MSVSGCNNPCEIYFSLITDGISTPVSKIVLSNSVLSFLTIKYPITFFPLVSSIAGISTPENLIPSISVLKVLPCTVLTLLVTSVV